jgi:cytochrome c2
MRRLLFALLALGGIAAAVGWKAKAPVLRDTTGLEKLIGDKSKGEMVFWASGCASCHMAYPPAFLSKSAWQKIMGGLDRHYGADASIDTITQRQIGIWLQAQAGTYKRVEVSSPGERITTTQWFEKKHRKIDKAVWGRQSIKGKAQCQACHTSADIGDFEDERVRIPK